MKFIVSTSAFLCVLAAVPALTQESAITLPEAPERETVVRVCSNCHAIQRVVDQKRPADEWDRIVAVMVDRGAQANDAEQTAILDYLVKFFGQ